MDKKIKFTPKQLTELQSFFQQNDFTANMTFDREYDFKGEQAEIFVRTKKIYGEYWLGNLRPLGVKRKMKNFSKAHPVNFLENADADYFSKQISEIYTDPDKLSEYIDRFFEMYIYQMTGCKKPIYRLWISSMEDAAIAQGFRELKDGKEYDNLFAAARCREWADWLVGINATRLFSVLYHRTLNVGRVVSPTLAILVQREADIMAFKPEPFYTAEVDFGSFTAASEKFKKKSDAEAVIPKANEPVVVESVTSKEKSEKAPALYDLTTLQREANRQLGYTAQQTLDYVALKAVPLVVCGTAPLRFVNYRQLMLCAYKVTQP